MYVLDRISSKHSYLFVVLEPAQLPTILLFLV